MPASPNLSFETRQECLSQLDQQTWDLVIIGGGITGAACARDAALRGVKTLLIEAEDFASGTSSGSTKLLHGGLRYLQNYEFKLVYTAIREREKLEKLYAPFVHELDFVFPTYKKLYPPRWLLGMGLTLYDSFSYFSEQHKSLNKQKAKKAFPYLQEEGLTGALVYRDDFAEDYRLVIELIKSAEKHGARCINRAAATHFDEQSDGSFVIGIRDTWDDHDLKTRAKSVLNCAGPFSDEIRSKLKIKPSLHLTQGVHFILERKKLPIDEAYVLSDPDYDRILFAIPWNSVTYIGTTDTDVKRVQDARATHEDLKYVLSIVNKYLNAKLSESDVIHSWAAVRPLIEPEEGASNSKISREHQIEERPNNFFHILGGKLTSHREIAEEALDLMAKKLAWPRDCKTSKIPLQDIAWTKKAESHLEKMYGHYAQDVRDIDQSRGLSRKQITSSHPHLVSEVIYSIHHEMVLSPIDFLRRRCSLYYEKPCIETAEAVGRILKEELRYDPTVFSREMDKTVANYKWDIEGFQS